MPSPIPEPLIDRVARYAALTEDGCLEWLGKRNVDGYGHFNAMVEPGVRKTLNIHRWMYEWAFGEIPHGLAIDHLCRNRACLMPSHLEAVTVAENNRRAVAANGVAPTCRKGHPHSDENTGRYPNGKRYCKTCRRIQQRLRYHAQKQAS